ncbi:MAG: transpeptidase family protein [Bacteroidetes bacterium]|nr:transpeptidase family protein [Bacteroidota bacterium]
MSTNRILLIIGVMTLFLGVLLTRLIFIQVVKAEDYSYFANKQQVGIEPLLPERGSIFDRNGTILVYTKNEVSFFVDPKLARKYKKDSVIAKILADSLELNYTELKAKIDSSKKTFCILKKVDAKKALKLKNVVKDGLFYEPDPTRVYEYKSLASHITGFVNREGKGTDGIESSFNDLLKGKEGSRFVLKDGTGAVMSVLEENYKDAVPGDNIGLTIDRAIQRALEMELEAGVKAARAENATGIVMDPNTGEVLALANYPSYDPEQYMKFSDDTRRNRAISDVYEPGSTFKGIALAGILDKKLATVSTVVNTENGRYNFMGKEIKDHHGQASMTVKEIIRYSSNIGMLKLSQKMEKNDFYQYLRSFGFGNYTYAGLPGEVKGRLGLPAEWSGTTKGSIAYGYGISLTPIQLITAYSALINGGVLYKPLLVREIKDVRGNIKEFNNPVKIREVITAETSQIIRSLLADVVENGTGKKARIEGIKIGGKTGTSRKIVNGEYSKERYNSSFIGFFPADNPKYICLILVNSPKSIGITGGEVAAPVFKNVARRILVLDKSIGGNLKLDSTPEENDIEIISPEGETDEPETEIKEEVRIKRVDAGKLDTKEMPDLKGVSLKEAIAVAKRLDLAVTWTGSGRVIEQSIKPGSAIRKNLKINLILQEKPVYGANIY